MSNEKTAIVGTPCQVLAATKINQFEEMTGGSSIDVKIGLFCMENFSYSYLKQYLNENGIHLKDVVEFRIEKGKFVVYLNDGEELTMPIAKTEPFTRKNCNICTDYTADTADISVGSVGSPKNYSTVIIRSEKGKKIIENGEKEGYFVTEQISEKGKNLLEKIANKKINNNKIIIQKREDVGRPVLSKRDVNDKEFALEANQCYFENLESDVISVGACVLCGACEFVCPKDIIHIDHRKPQKHGECDEDCHACYYACPRTYVSTSILPNNIDDKPLGDYLDILTVKADSIKGQDGGAVSAILIYLLEKELVDNVFVVGEDENEPWMPKSYVTNKVEDVISASGTKYSTVPIGFKALTNKK